MDNRITDKSVNITSTSRSTSAGKSPKTVYTMKCPISRTKVHSILLFSPFSVAAAAALFFSFPRKNYSCVFFLFQVSCMVIHARSHTYESGIGEYDTHTHTMLPKMYKIPRNGKSKNPKIQ